MILNQLNMQDMIGPACQEYLGFHDYGLSIMLGVFVIVGIFLLYLQFSGGIVFDYTEDTKLEFFWTFIPGVILISLALPSLKLLYLMDSPGYSSLNYAVKVVGHQWYWSYELIFQGSELNYDSYMLAEDELVLGDFRLLEVDNPLLFLAGCFNQIYVTSDDVIHSFALPALGIKLDAIPGRLNSQIVSALYVGSYYGQCSEICGMNHSFMPINIEVVKEIK
uniref:Cytochrome c oxidase subunit 2 n=1 Tax=Syndesmis kurakaikina TaxID=2711315 RepID=A0A7G5XUK4_9PLAT|nr:cytochrome c oxidase subunit 2 [Syndesmis kurakaikina]